MLDMNKISGLNHNLNTEDFQKHEIKPLFEIALRLASRIDDKTQ